MIWFYINILIQLVTAANDILEANVFLREKETFPLKEEGLIFASVLLAGLALIVFIVTVCLFVWCKYKSAGVLNTEPVKKE